MNKLRVLDLFSGIGGFSLGLERTGGFETVAFCEIDPFCRRVLSKHWPDVPCFDDVTTLRGEDVGTIDVICGGFPCQDISYAGLGAGMDGARSGLWSDYARLVGELRPSFVIVENVAALLGRGLDRVLGDLAALGFDAEWHCIPASAVGAPHRRDRIWILAYPNPCLHAGGLASREDPRQAGGSEGGHAGEGQAPDGEWLRLELGSGGSHVADSDRNDGKGQFPSLSYKEGRQGQIWRQTGSCGDGFDWWETEPDVGRVADGVPARMDRLKSLGNAVVPQIPELIGRAILASLESERAAA